MARHRLRDSDSCYYTVLVYTLVYSTACCCVQLLTMGGDVIDILLSQVPNAARVVDIR